MLLELDALARGLKAAGVEAPIIHNDIQRPGKRPTLRVSLDAEGAIEQLSLIETQELMDCWTMGDGNKNQFPAIKLSAPLRSDGHNEWSMWRAENMRATGGELWAKMEELRSRYPLNLDGISTWPDKGYREKIISRSVRVMESEQSLEMPRELYKRFRMVKRDGLALLEDLDQGLWQKCTANADEVLLKMAGTVFFGEKLKASGQEDDNKKVTLLLDVSGVPFDKRPASHRVWVSQLSAALFASENAVSKVGICSVSGEDTILLDNKLPKINLPIIGNTTLYSRFDGGGNKAVRRYGRAATNALAVSAERSDAMAAALTYLARECARGKYWLPIECNGGGSDVFFAWCAAAQDVDLVSPVAGREEYEVEDDEDYARVAEKTVAALQGKATELNAEANFIVLHKISDGVQKITWSSGRSLQKLMEAVFAWRLAGENHPPISIAMKKAKFQEGPSLRWHPVTVAPLQLLSLSRIQYTVNGKQKVKLPGLSTGLAMQLFWGSGDAQRNAARFFLDRLYRQFHSLLERIAVNSRAYKLATGKQYDTNFDERREALQCLGGLAIVLFKLGREKDVYMEGVAYRLGQLCAAWDELHIGYCDDVRGGQLPARLLGNKAYAMAVNNPTKALEIVSMRVGPYAAWATKTMIDLKTSKIEEGEGRKKSRQLSKQALNGAYAYRWAGEVSEALAKDLLATNNRPFDGQYKAELLLGYMAGRPYKGNETKENEDKK